MPQARGSAPRTEGTFLTAYCGKLHRLDGLPVGHRCRALPIQAVIWELHDNLEAVLAALEAHPLVLHDGVIGPATEEP